jgi:hypothetical protein
MEVVSIQVEWRPPIASKAHARWLEVFQVVDEGQQEGFS